MKQTLKHKKNQLSFSTSKEMKWLRTPKDIWEQLSSEFKFTIDVCATKKNTLLPRYYTKEVDGLKQDWTGETAYIHPLFDTNIWRWVKKAYETKNFTGVLLLPASVHTKYFHEWIYHNKNCEIRFLRKPLGGFRFGHDDDFRLTHANKMGYLRPLMIIIFRNKCVHSL